MSKKIAEQDGSNDAQDGIASQAFRYAGEERTAYEQGYKRGLKLKRQGDAAKKKLSKPFKWT